MNRAKIGIPCRTRGQAFEPYREALESLRERLGKLNDLSAAGLQLAEQGAARVLCEVWVRHERTQLNDELPHVVKKLALLDLAEAPWRSQQVG